MCRVVDGEADRQDQVDHGNRVDGQAPEVPIAGGIVRTWRNHKPNLR